MKKDHIKIDKSKGMIKIKTIKDKSITSIRKNIRSINKKTIVRRKKGNKLQEFKLKTTITISESLTIIIQLTKPLSLLNKKKSIPHLVNFLFYQQSNI